MRARIFVVLAISTLPLIGCSEAVSPELTDAMDGLEAQLREARAAEYAPEGYTHFVAQWVGLKARLADHDETIIWPWESNPLLAQVDQLRRDGEAVLAESHANRAARRRDTEARLSDVEGRLQTLNARVEQMGSRIVLGRKPAETALLVHQARSFFEQGLYERSAQLAQQAGRLLQSQAIVLTSELGHYADHQRVEAWRRLARATIDWSRTHHAAAIIVSKSDHRLTLYRNGTVVRSYPVRLGYNGMLEKRHQGDGATPEGRYHVTAKKDRGHTQFYKALLLDYPNPDDVRRFQRARQAGRIPAHASIGGQIEIHGEDNALLSQTLGCVMLRNADMDRLFREVEPGTPVVIVGALHVSNTVSLALAGLHQFVEG